MWDDIGELEVIDGRYYYINSCDGKIFAESDTENPFDVENERIGNYFYTKYEAEQQRKSILFMKWEMEGDLEGAVKLDFERVFNLYFNMEMV